MVSIHACLIICRLSHADSIRLPSIPPPSPPPGVTVFPDEIHNASEPVAAPRLEPSPPRPVIPRRPSRRGASAAPTPATPMAPAISPVVPTFPIAGPSRSVHSPTPPVTVSMADLVPRSRRVFSPSLPSTVPDWISMENYSVAENAPSTPPHVLMPLESDYTANLPQLPPIQSRHTHRRRRKDSKSDEGPANLYKLQASYEINPVSSSLSKSSKCVLTSDWRVATAELRHIRAMERIEEKKENGRWSLRQPKKLKTLPVRKGHWDYLLEEMVSLSHRSYVCRVCAANGGSNGCAWTLQRNVDGSVCWLANSHIKWSSGIYQLLRTRHS